MDDVIIRALRMATRTEGYQVHVFHPEHPRMCFEGDLVSALIHVGEEMVDVTDPDTTVTFIYQAKSWWSGKFSWFCDPACPGSIAKLVESHCREPWHHEAPEA